MGYIAIVDYGVGNLMSVGNALAYLGYQTKIAADSAAFEQALSLIHI